MAGPMNAPNDSNPGPHEGPRERPPMAPAVTTRPRRHRTLHALATMVLIAVGGGATHQIAQTYPPYQEPWRPQFHYSQPNLFMNDPNGLVYYAGEWHLFYQSRPGGGIVWGHAISKDLVHWDNLPVAIPRQ